MANDLSGDQFAEIARSLNVEPDAANTLEEATATAVSIIEGCDRAGISLVVKRGRITTIAPTDDLVVRADELQLEVGEGPCLQSIREEETVYAPDLLVEKRWPRWVARVSQDLHIRSVLVLQLFVGTDTLGSLKLYSDSPDAFGAEDRTSALALASHVAVAVTAAQEYDGMVSALRHRSVIGQAQGMLMQGLTITPEQAFAALVRVSQNRNLKLHVVASDIVEHGIRPQLFA